MLAPFFQNVLTGKRYISSAITFFTYSGFVSNNALVFSHQVSDASIKSGRAICNNLIRYQLWIWKIKLHTPVNGLTIDDVTNFLYKFWRSWPILFSRFPCCVLCHGTQMKIQVQISWVGQSTILSISSDMLAKLQEHA